MSATNCRTCKGIIAARIKKCPHCGETYPDADQLKRNDSRSVLSLFVPRSEESKKMDKAFSQFQRDQKAEEKHATNGLIDGVLSKIPTPIKVVGLGLIGIALLSGKKEEQKK